MEKLKKKVFERFFSDDDKSLIEEAYNMVVAKHSIQKEKVTRSTTLDGERLFGKINDTISYLNELKSQGYEEIEETWYGYVATKPSEETDEEFYDRIAEWVSEEYEQLEKEKEAEEVRKQKILQLKEEIRKLENQK